MIENWPWGSPKRPDSKSWNCVLIGAARMVSGWIVPHSRHEHGRCWAWNVMLWSKSQLFMLRPEPWISEQEDGCNTLPCNLQEINAMCATGQVAHWLGTPEPVSPQWMDGF
jgi:hypothetical protein